MDMKPLVEDIELKSKSFFVKCEELWYSVNNKATYSNLITSKTM